MAAPAAAARTPLQQSASNFNMPDVQMMLASFQSKLEMQDVKIKLQEAEIAELKKAVPAKKAQKRKADATVKNQYVAAAEGTIVLKAKRQRKKANHHLLHRLHFQLHHL